MRGAIQVLSRRRPESGANALYEQNGVLPLIDAAFHFSAPSLALSRRK
jgi:hypothetical protein